MPAWKSGSSTPQMLPSVVLERRLRRSDLGQLDHELPPLPERGDVLPQVGHRGECGSNTYSTSLYSPVAVIVAPSQVVARGTRSGSTACTC